MVRHGASVIVTGEICDVLSVVYLLVVGRIGRDDIALDVDSLKSISVSHFNDAGADSSELSSSRHDAIGTVP